MTLARNRSLIAQALAAACALMGAVPAHAQFAKTEDAIKYRRAAFTMLGTHFGRVAAMAQGKLPFDAKAAADNADLAATLSKLPFAGFVPGSDSGNTKAEPKIWTEMDKFNAAAKTMQEAVAKVDAAAKTGSLDAIKGAVGDAGRSCKSCHDNYRKE